jgi:hypothetical protein
MEKGALFGRPFFVNRFNRRTASSENHPIRMRSILDHDFRMSHLPHPENISGLILGEI